MLFHVSVVGKERIDFLALHIAVPIAGRSSDLITRSSCCVPCKWYLFGSKLRLTAWRGKKKEK